jgi:hypothetical protein
VLPSRSWHASRNRCCISERAATVERLVHYSVRGSSKISPPVSSTQGCAASGVILWQSEHWEHQSCCCPAHQARWVDGVRNDRRTVRAVDSSRPCSVRSPDTPGMPRLAVALRRPTTGDTHRAASRLVDKLAGVLGVIAAFLTPSLGACSLGSRCDDPRRPKSYLARCSSLPLMPPLIGCAHWSGLSVTHFHPSTPAVACATDRARLHLKLDASELHQDVRQIRLA